MSSGHGTPTGRSYVALLLDATLGFAVFVSPRVHPRRVVASRRNGRASLVGRALAFPPLVVGVLTLVRFPLSFWREHIRERSSALQFL